MTQYQPSGKPRFDILDGSNADVAKKLNAMLSNSCGVSVLGMSSCIDKNNNIITSVLILWDKLIPAGQQAIVIPQLTPQGHLKAV